MDSTLTKEERRNLGSAEQVIRAGLRSFVEVGLALTRIRDGRLYRGTFATFEDYMLRRWDFSRQRGYELMSASEVVKDLTATADIDELPLNEAQARPLTRLKASEHRRQAWLMAVQLASEANRPVTARDAEDAVKKISGKIIQMPVDGVPPFDRLHGIRAAYADPPYMGQGKRRYGCDEVDHKELIERLENFDSWALSLSSPSLRHILPLCPEGVRVGAWVKPYCAFFPNVNPVFSWEPVIFKLSDRIRPANQLKVRDWLSQCPTRERGLCGAKPDEFAHWIFSMLDLRPGDEFFDLFEGTGAVTRAYRTWIAETYPEAAAS